MYGNPYPGVYPGVYNPGTSIVNQPGEQPQGQPPVNNQSAGYESREEMSRHRGDGYSMGHRPKVMPVFNRQMAEDWGSRMQNADGTRGPHFSMDKAEEVMKQYNVDCDPLEFYVVLNSLYSDYDQALKKNNASTLELYACLAKAWTEDKDAVPDKLAAYYTYMVKR